MSLSTEKSPLRKTHTTDSARTVHTFCRYCHASCGIDVTVANNRVLKISADKQNPHSWHDFCAKGRTAGQLVEHPRRLVNPMRRVGDSYVEATWDEAITDISARLKALIAADGPDAVGVYYGNPTGFSMSNLIFMQGLFDGIGSNSRYSVGSIDSNSFFLVAEQMYGSFLMTPVSDVDNCDYFMIFGANPAVSAWNWLETVPRGWRRALDRQQDGAKIVVVDPVRTETAEKADLHIMVRPGQDWALMLGMVKVILAEGLEHEEDCRQLVTGIDSIRALAAAADLEDLAARCDVAPALIEQVAREFAGQRRAMVVTRTGVALHETGAVAEWLGNVLNVITGRMDRPGGRRFERGYVDALRIAGMTGKNSHNNRLSGWPTIAGAHSLVELPAEITTPGPGQIRALIINAGNPVVSGPDGAKLDAALSQLDLLVAVDLVQRESHRHAHWLLPATHWLEREDLPVLTGSLTDEPFVQFGARAVEPPPGTRDEWTIWVDLALAMRAPMFGIKGLNGFIKSTRAIATRTGKPGLAFHPQWLDRLLVATSRKINGRRLKWRDIMANPHGLILGTGEFGHFRAALRTPDKRVHVAPTMLVERTRDLLATPAPTAPEGFPYQVGNRRRRHSMNSYLNELPALHPAGKHNDVLIHPADAAELGIAEGDRVRVFSPVASVELGASLSDGLRRGLVVIDHGWGSRVFDPRGGEEPESLGVNRNLLVDTRAVDPLSYTSALGATYVGLERVSD